MGGGIANRDHDGVMLAAFVGRREGIIDPGVAEALTAWQAVEVSQHLGLCKIVLEGDALEVVNVLKHEGMWMGRYGHLLQDAKQRLNHCLD